MVDINLGERNAFFISAAFCAFAAAVTFIEISATTVSPFIGIAIILLAALCIAGIYASFAFGYLVMPFVTAALGVGESLGNGYRIPPNQEAVVREIGGVYQATMYMRVSFYEMALNEGETPVTSAYMELWERALAGIKFPFKFCLITYLQDLSKYREEIETRRYAATLKLGKERENTRPDPLAIDKWEREIARMNAMLNRLAEGEKPLGCVMYSATTAVGANEAGAVAAAKRQVSEIRSSVANALNVEVKPIKGEDLKRCFNFDIYVPPDKGDFERML